MESKNFFNISSEGDYEHTNLKFGTLYVEKSVDTVFQIAFGAKKV